MNARNKSKRWRSEKTRAREEKLDENCKKGVAVMRSVEN